MFQNIFKHSDYTENQDRENPWKNTNQKSSTLSVQTEKYTIPKERIHFCNKDYSRQRTSSAQVTAQVLHNCSPELFESTVCCRKTVRFDSHWQRGSAFRAGEGIIKEEEFF